MKNRVQDGKTITLIPTADVASGGALLAGAMLAVAITAVAENTPGEFVAEGVYELPKASADTVTAGDQLYWDDTAQELTTTATDNTPAGKAWADAGNGETLVSVKINA
ncbi:DUF2190 family protein [Shewanella sp. 3B26]|uniref:DUF2190 family protein n=1 Tax=Shewanella zhuhaiensis TaxID=2919576 RepID=A0AAJ1BG68_9GAMM|nr:capsid cement protein [Shewanella zhuhaiensis]MCH4294221.1 DUF2190 family protein [Shewanella zhuhaiensis]